MYAGFLGQIEECETGWALILWPEFNVGSISPYIWSPAFQITKFQNLIEESAIGHKVLTIDE